MYQIVRGDVLKKHAGSVVVHACNCQGVWGSGFAAALKKIAPKSYLVYKAFCRDRVLGRSLYIEEEGEPKIACLMTSFDYGKRVDSPGKILKATASALDELFCQSDGDFVSPKFNSGLFRVPWDRTEKLILDKLRDRNWTVFEY